MGALEDFAETAVAAARTTEQLAEALRDVKALLATLDRIAEQDPSLAPEIRRSKASLQIVVEACASADRNLKTRIIAARDQARAAFLED